MELTKKEQQAIDFALKNVEEDRQDALQSWKENFEKFEKQFNNEIGQAEATDRSYVFLESWDRFVLEHPFVLLRPEIHRIAYLAQALMQEAYNAIATIEIEEEKNAIASTSEGTDSDFKGNESIG